MKVPRIKARKGPFDQGQAPKLNSDGDILKPIGDAVVGATRYVENFDATQPALIADEQPVFDYFKTRADLERRFTLHMEPAERRMAIDDNEADFVVILGNDTEIGLVVRNAIVSYHLEKAQARNAKA